MLNGLVCRIIIKCIDRWCISVAGSISMDGGQPRGILKNADTGGDDTYLFCNVPEHHDLVNNIEWGIVRVCGKTRETSYCLLLIVISMHKMHLIFMQENKITKQQKTVLSFFPWILFVFLRNNFFAFNSIRLTT